MSDNRSRRSGIRLLGDRSPSHILCLIALSLTFVATCVAFFNSYAFDDSYFGYSIAQSIREGRGFSFNGNDHILSTSAPLAPLLYAALAPLFNDDIVFIGQMFSALAIIVVLFATYGLARRHCTNAGALLASVTFVTNPFILLLWSHESLLSVACLTFGLWAYFEKRLEVAAVALGIGTLFRGEVLLALPFLYFNVHRTRDGRTLTRFVICSIAPFLAWCAIAIPLFGSPFSATIASKHAQARYPGNELYVQGLFKYLNHIYVFGSSSNWLGIVVATLLLCVCAGIATGIAKRVHLQIAIWVICVTLTYISLQLPFFFWFAIQFGVAIAVIVALVWSRESPKRFPKLVIVAKGGSLSIALLNAVFLALQIGHPGGPQNLFAWIVAPRIADNPYRRLGEYFARPGHAAASIAFLEFGQLHYYSRHTIVDLLGIVTPGALKELSDGNPIWTLKQYEPAAVVDTRAFTYLVSPSEYDWFWRAYGTPDSSQQLTYSGDPFRSSFNVYRLHDASKIPPPDEPSPVSNIRIRREAKGLRFTFDSLTHPISEVEARIRIPPACGSLKLDLQSGVNHQVEYRTLPDLQFARLTMQPKWHLLVPTSFAIRGCSNIEPAPLEPLRSGPSLLFNTPPVVREQDALVLYQTSKPIVRTVSTGSI